MTTPKSVSTISDLQSAAARARSAYLWEEAVAHYTVALAAPGLSATDEFDLRDGRADCFQRLANFQAEYEDLAAMAKLAGEMGNGERILETETRLAIVLERLGEFEKSRSMARKALERARQTGSQLYQARAIYALGLTYITTGEFESGERELVKAVQLFQGLGALRDEALCTYYLAFAGARTGQNAEPLAQRVLELAQLLDDRLLEGRAYQILDIVFESDPTRATKYREQALEIYEAIGEAAGIRAMTADLALYYFEYGLPKRAYALINQALQLAEHNDSRAAHLLSLHLAAWVALELGDLEAADSANQRVISRAQDAGVTSIEAYAKAVRGQILWRRNEREAAIQMMEAAAEQIKSSPAHLPLVLGWLGSMYLEQGELDAARRATDQALEWADELHNSPFLEVPLWSSYRVHHQAAKTKIEAERAWEILHKARDVLLQRIRNLADQGLCRRYLSGPFGHPEILLEYARQAHQRGEALALLHLERPARNNEQQFKRLLDTGTRLASQSDPESLLAFIMDEFVDLSGAERAFIALRGSGNETHPEVVLSRGLEPREETEVHRRAAPLIDQAMLSRQAVLSQKMGAAPEGEPPEIHLRSGIIVPLVSHSRVMGVLYADIREIFGPFNREDAILLTLLANQAAAALENANWTRTLERRVRDRTIELETVNKIGEGLLANLDLDGILQVVGEHVQQRFGTHTVVIVLKDPSTEEFSVPYLVLDGKRLEPVELPPEQGLTSVVIEQNAALLISSYDEMQEYPFVLPKQAQDQPLREISWIGVPLRRGTEVMGALCVAELQDHVYDDSDVQLLSTIAANMGVAIENARLFDETAQRNVELAVINEIQQGLAAQLDFQAIIDLVGDKIKDIFKAPSIAIVLFEPEQNLMHFRYGFLEGARETIESMPISGFSKRVYDTCLLYTSDAADEN